MDLNDIIKNNFIYRYENNELKTKKLIIAPFINICTKQPNNIFFRPHLVGDVISRFFRQQNYNVMFNVNCNNLNDNYFINSKLEYGRLNDNILINHLNLLNELNINYDYNKSIHLLDKDVNKLYQNLFLFLYNNNLIKYEENIVYYDPSYSYVYDMYQTKNLNHPKNEYALFLDISKYMDHIVNNVNKLLINEDIKKSFKNILGEEIKYKLHLVSNNQLNIDIDLENPYELGSLACVLVGVSSLDILEYINPNQISYLEGYFKTRSAIYFDTHNYVVNPLTGNKVPIFIAKNIKGFKGLFYKDKELLEILNIKPIKVLNDNNTLMNSDYLNDLTIDSANNTLVNDFVDEGIISSSKVYTNDKILLSSNNNYGLVAPIMIEENKMFLLSNKLPIYYDDKFNLNITNGNFKVYSKPLNNSFISLFNYIINIIYDKDREFSKDINDDLLYNIKRLLNNSLVIYNVNNEAEEILLPIIFLTILEQLNNVKLVDRIEFLGIGDSFDNYGFDFKEENNNLINYEQVIKLYNSDSLRLYLLNNNISNKLYFYKDDIFKYKQILFDLEMIVNNLSDYNPLLDIDSIRLKENIIENMASYNFDVIISNIIKYIKYLRQNKPSKQQFLALIFMLYCFIPQMCNKINLNNYKNKLDLLFINWTKDM